MSSLYHKRKPLAIDLYAGLGGWTEGFLAEGYDVVGFDIERHVYGDQKYPAHLVLQDILTIHGSQFRSAQCLVASPPCQEFSYMAMPFSRGKQIARALRGLDEFPRGYTGSHTIFELTALFDACFRIQREACEASGRHIPMVVENVRGAQPWVGKATYNFGSFYLFGGDVPPLMPSTGSRRLKSRISCAPRNFSERVANTPEEAHALHYRMPDETTNKEATGRKVPGMNFHDHEKTGKPGRSFQSAAVKVASTKRFEDTPMAWMSSKSSARKAASAQIAKIPLALSRWIAQVYFPR